jgi:hypothetical protein
METTAAPNAAMAAGMIAGMMFMMVLYLAIYLFFALCLMLIAKKMNIANSWLAWIPIANIYLMTQMAGRPGWWTILMFIPLVNMVIGIMLWVDILKKLGKNPWMVLVVIFFGIIYLPILAFSKK